MLYLWLNIPKMMLPGFATASGKKLTFTGMHTSQILFNVTAFQNTFPFYRYGIHVFGHTILHLAMLKHFIWMSSAYQASQVPFRLPCPQYYRLANYASLAYLILSIKMVNCIRLLNPVKMYFKPSSWITNALQQLWNRPDHLGFL